MTRHASALAALGVSALLAVFLVRSRGEAPALLPAPVASCGDGTTCGGDAPVPTVSRETASGAEVAPPAVAVPHAGAPSPLASAGAVRREDADRLLAAGKVREAVDALRAVVAAEPTAVNHGDLGHVLYRLTAFDEAAQHLRAAAELDPGNADRWIALANVYYRKVNPGEAWKAEKRAREAEPGLELGRDAEGMRIRKSDANARRP